MCLELHRNRENLEEERMTDLHLHFVSIRFRDSISITVRFLDSTAILYNWVQCIMIAESKENLNGIEWQSLVI